MKQKVSKGKTAGAAEEDRSGAENETQKVRLGDNFPAASWGK